MRSSIALLVLLACSAVMCLMLSAAVGPSAALDPHCIYLQEYKVKLVDTAKFQDGSMNFLFRGNMPKNASEEFAYDELMHYMQLRAAEANYTLPPNTKLLVMSFETMNPSEINNTMLEYNFFKNNPQYGEFKSWGFYIYYSDPNNFTAEQVYEMVQGPVWGDDMMPQRIEEAYEYLWTQKDTPIALYVHCSCGCDRTGEFVGGYLQRWKNMTLVQALEEDLNHGCGRAPVPSARYGVQWYCYFMHYVVRGQSLLSIGQACAGNFTVDPLGVGGGGGGSSSSSSHEPEPTRPVFAGIFLTEESSARLLKEFPPMHTNIGGGGGGGEQQAPLLYVPITFDPLRHEKRLRQLPWGGVPVPLSVEGYAEDDRAQVVVVRDIAGMVVDTMMMTMMANGEADDLEDVLRVPHIAVSLAQSVGPLYPAYMLNHDETTTRRRKGYQHQLLLLEGRVGMHLSDGTISYMQ